VKRCNCCGIEKPLAEYPPDTQNRDGRKGKCRACVLARQRELRAEHPEKERAWVAANRDSVLSSKRRWRARNADKERIASRLRARARREDPEAAALLRQRASEYLARNRDAVAERARRSRAEDPRRFRAREAVGKALARAVLQRPSCCSRCGATSRPEAHHRSYEREHWLEVEWLCSRCHRREHRIPDGEPSETESHEPVTD
jgi:hypothetical protein